MEDSKKYIGFCEDVIDRKCILNDIYNIYDIHDLIEEYIDIPIYIDIHNNDIQLLNIAHHPDPFSVIGYFIFENIILFRAWLYKAEEIYIKIFDKKYKMIKRADWLFQKAFKVKSAKINIDYELWPTYAGSTVSAPVKDTYSFGILLPEYDLNLFQSGSCWHVDSLLGAHYMKIRDTWGTRFGLWAPNAQFVSVVGDFNSWDGRVHPMRRRSDFGVWELFIPNTKPGQLYGYRIHSRAGSDFIKIDPFAQEFQNPPEHASIISGCDDAYKSEEERYQWGDELWMKERVEKATTIRELPMSIYEVHLPSWMRGENNSYLGFRELAERLVKHLSDLNFTHVEFLPVNWHPFEGSWGYQTMGLYAPYSRLGSPDDLKYLIDHLHQAGIGVFVDFVPGHFCKDDWGMVCYDGEPLFEYRDPREGEHHLWGTKVFNYRRNEVRSFLMGAAYHWLRRYHVDGLRIDAVSSILYKNHCRKDGEWIPNEHGGDANLQAITLLQEMNWVIHNYYPGVFTMAEESTCWKGVTDDNAGLKFDVKWDLGWMNDTLSYLCFPQDEREKQHQKLTFRGIYVGNERWILPLSHDEVVSGKGSLLDKMGFKGAAFADRIRTLRCLYGFQIGLPGRPLIFMGGEIAQGREWSDGRSIDWHEGKEHERSKTCTYLSDVLKLYKTRKALHAGDDQPYVSFKWNDCDNAKDGMLAFTRSHEEWFNDILVICNFSYKNLPNYPIGVTHGGHWKVLINSDDWSYAGTMYGPGNGKDVHTKRNGRLGWPSTLYIDVPPFSCIMLEAPQPDQFGLTVEEVKLDHEKNKKSFSQTAHSK
eukprot:GHVL01031973.1.p1 GENE.GHVL01031973.1~~GHVL01031973.1.p1  ORF type:complete len:814 (-),score=138.12 GHVL01031973.1:1627-4068(-)